MHAKCVEYVATEKPRAAKSVVTLWTEFQGNCGLIPDKGTDIVCRVCGPSFHPTIQCILRVISPWLVYEIYQLTPTSAEIKNTWCKRPISTIHTSSW